MGGTKGKWLKSRPNLGTEKQLGANGLLCSLICAYSAMIEQPFAANGGSKSVCKAEFWQIGQSDLNRPFSEILQRGDQGKIAQK